MMIAYKYLSKPMDIKSGIVTLVIENKKLFRDTVSEILNGNENELFIVSKNFTPVDFNKTVSVINNALDIEFNNKKMMSKIYTGLEVSANELFLKEVFEVKGMLFNLAEKLCREYDFDLKASEDIDTSSIIKLLDFKVREDADNYLEKIILYIKLIEKYLKIKLFIFYNLNLYCSYSEMQTLCETLKSMDVCCLDIENHIDEVFDKNNTYIIDNDLCEVIYNEE